VGKWDLSVLEKAFADAAVDPSLWNNAMAVASEVTGGNGAAMFPISGRLPFLPHCEQIAACLNTYISDGWINRDERYRGLSSIMRRGVATDLDFATIEEINRHPYYQEFLASHGLRWFAGVLVSSGSDQWCLSIQRSIKAGPFSHDEQSQLAKVSPSLSSAAAIARALGFSAAKVALEAFELSGTAIVLLNRAGEPIRLNRRAEKLLGNGLRISKKRLAADARDATDCLDRSLRKLLWVDLGSALMPPVRLPRQGQQPLLAYPLKLSTMTENIFSHAHAMLVLIDLERRNRPPEASLQELFGLSSAEARLASRIATGESIDRIADEFRISKETARNHLKSIFAKTGVHRQAEFVALMASLLSPLVGA